MLRRALKNYCWKTGFFVQASSSREDVQKFIKNLRPIKIDVPLIRVGGCSDGGYIVPNDLSKIDALYSPGVANNSNFELELAHKDIKSYLIDYSVDKAAVDHANIHFDKKFLGAEDNEIFWTLSTWINKYTPNDKNLMMQIDIEGAEYESFITSKAETLRRFRVIVAEFHGLDSILNLYGLKFFKLCFEKLLKDFYVVHLHPNNSEGEVKKWGVRVPRLMEITLVRKGSYQNLGFASHFPHPLDETCVPSMPDLQLDRFWFND